MVKLCDGALAQLFQAHFQAEEQHPLAAARSCPQCQGEGERRLSHSRARPDDHELSGPQPLAQRIEITEAGLEQIESRVPVPMTRNRSVGLTSPGKMAWPTN